MTDFSGSRGQVWNCIKFPNRSVRIVGNFVNTLMHVRPFGWLVQGMTDGKDYGSRYEITDEDLIAGFARNRRVAWIKRLLNLRLHIEFRLE